MGQVLALKEDITIGRKPAANLRNRARVIDAYHVMVRERGWDHYKLRKVLEKRGVYALPYFPDDGLELTLHLPNKHYKSKDFYRIFIQLKLARKCTHFDAYLIVQIAHSSEGCRLHKPIRVPVVTTLKAQAEEVMKAYHALYDGVFCVIGPEALPEWPGDEGLERMNERVVLSAKQALNHIAGLQESDEDFQRAVGRPRRNYASKNVISIKREN